MGMAAVIIDVGKATLDVDIEDVACVAPLVNDAAGTRKLVECLSGLVDALIVFEATGNLARMDATDARLLCLLAQLFANPCAGARQPRTGSGNSGIGLCRRG